MTEIIHYWLVWCLFLTIPFLLLCDVVYYVTKSQVKVITEGEVCLKPFKTGLLRYMDMNQTYPLKGTVVFFLTMVTLLSWVVVFCENLTKDRSVASSLQVVSDALFPFLNWVAIFLVTFHGYKQCIPLMTKLYKLSKKVNN